MAKNALNTTKPKTNNVLGSTKNPLEIDGTSRGTQGGIDGVINRSPAGSNISFGTTQVAPGMDSRPVNPWGQGMFTINKNYFDNLNASKDAYDKYITTLTGGADGANAALDNARSNAIDQIQRTYDDSARNYYRLYRKQENDLPEQLSSIGATGGASETAALNLLNKYSDNVYRNENGRNDNISDVNAEYYNAVAKNSQQLAQQIAEAYLQQAQYESQLQSQKAEAKANLNSQLLAYQQEQAQQQAAAKAEREEAERLYALSNRNNNVRSNEAERNRQGYTTKSWTDKYTGEYHYRITGKKKVANSSGSSKNSSSSGKSGSSGRNSGSGDTVPDLPITPTMSYDYALRNAAANMYGNSAYGMKTAGAADATAWLKKQVDSGKLSESNARKVLKQLGLS